MSGHQSVGVEIELAGLGVPEVADTVVAMLGGRVEATSEHSLRVRDTTLGSFKIKLDTRYAELGAEAGPAVGRLASGALDLAQALLPVEITAPPLPVAQIPRLDELLGRLAERGAKGTHANPAAAYGVHLNPSVDRFDADALQGWIQAFALAFAWLAHAVDANWTRRAVGFAKPYPEDYVRRVCSTAYAGDQGRLIDDYLAANPTRDRALDMLPLFAHVDAERVRRALPDEPVSARPTLHYRLPDCRIGEPGWSLALEWQRWSRVQRLAEDTTGRDALRQRFLAVDVASQSEEWREISRAWLDGTADP